MERHSLRRFYGRQIFKGALFASTALVLPVIAPRVALAQIAASTTPQGGVVVGGSASIAQAPGSTTVNQASERGAINWQSFDVGSAAKVQFNQPDAAAVTLNRVTGGNLSQINGQINANGQVVLINQSGVVFGKGSQVNAESVVVSTSDIATSDFMAGKMNFSGAPQPGAKIINDGNITARNAGLVGLIAPQVANNGVITAELGQVVLAGAAAFTLDLYGDRLISLDVTQAVRAVDVGGKPVAALVTNSGLIIADGGKVTMTAADADALVTQLIDAGGTIRADTAAGQTGTISVTGVGGNISIAGNLLARGTAPGTGGGAIEALTDGTVSVAPGADIDVSGAAGGGYAAIGTDLARAQTGPSDSAAPAAASVLIASGATIHTDATQSGNAGTVTLLSRNDTDFAGAITAQGGPQGGNGGLSEISSHGVISLSGTVLDTAIDGQPGEILLDPGNVTIATGGSANTTGSTIAPSYLDGLMGTVVITSSGAIYVLDGLDMSKASALTLNAADDVTIAAAVTVAGSIDIQAGGSLYIGPQLGVASLGLVTISNNLVSPGGITASNITLNSTDGLSIDALLSASGTLALSSAQAITEGSVSAQYFDVIAKPTLISGGIDAAVLTSGIGTLGNGSTINLADGAVILTNDDNDIAAIDQFTLQSGNQFALVNTGALNIGSFSASNANIAADGFDFSGPVDVAGDLQLQSGGAVSQTGGSLVAGTLNGFGSGFGGDVSLTSATNNITTLGLASLSAGHDFFINDADMLTLAGSLVAPTIAFGGAGVTEISGATLYAGTLESLGSIAGDVILGNLNTLFVLDGFTLGGDFVLDNSISLAVNGLLKDTGNGADVLLLAPTIASDAAGGITLSGTGARLGLAANSLDLGATLTAPTIEIAPLTSAVQTLSAAEAAFLDPGTLLRLGAYTTYGGSTPTITASALTFGTGGSLMATTLDLEATGAITQLDGAVSLDVGTLLLDAGNITLAAPQNTFNNLGSVTAANLILDDALDLNVRGNVSASGNITLSATQIELRAPVTATGVLDLVATDTSISQQSGAISAGTLTGTASGGVYLGDAGNVFHTIAGFKAASLLFDNAGTADIDGFLSAATTIALEGAAAEISGGTIHAAVLTSNGNTIDGNVSLTAAANSIGTLSNFLVGTGYALDLDSTGLLNLAGTVAAPSISLSAGTIALTGLLDANLLNLVSGSSITQTGGSLVVLGTLTGGAADDVSLTGANNTIDGIGAFAAGGTLALTDTATLAITGLVSAASEIDFSGTGFTESGAGALNATVFNIPTFTGLALLGGANAIGTINTVGGGGSAVLALNDTDALTLAGDLAGAGISFGGAGVTEVTGGEIDARTLGGMSLISGSVMLDQTNSIANVSGLTIAGAFVLADSKTLSVGTLIAQSATFSDNINNQTIDFTGYLSVAGSLELDYGQTGQGIFESGSITAGTLTGAADTGGVDLTGTNKIAVLASFDDAGIFDLADQTALKITAPLSASAVSLTDATAIDIDATVSAATGAAEFATSRFSLGSAGAISVASGQDIGIATDTLAIAAGGTLAAPAGTLALAPYNNTIIAVGGDQTGALNLDATTLAALQGATGSMTLDEFLIGQAAGHTAASIAILGSTDLSGFVSASGLIALYASTLITDTATLNAGTLAFAGGGFSQTSGGALDIAVLEGDGAITGPVVLTSTKNQIGDLGSIDSTASFNLTDATILSVTGPVLAQDITLEDLVAIALGGKVSVTNGTIQLIADTITQSAGTIDAGTGAVVLAPYDAGIGVDLGGTSTGGLQLAPALVEGIKAGQIDIGDAQGTVYAEGSVSLGSEELLLIGSAIEFAGTLEGLGLLSLASSGEVAEFSTSDVIDFASIAGLTGPIALIGNNSIGTIGDLSANGNIVLNNYESFIIDGLISTTGTISLEGAYYSETSNGVLEALVLNTGGTTIQGDVYLGGNNLIGTLTDFYVLAGSTFVFNNATALTVGDVTADDATLSATTLDFEGDVDSSQSLALFASLVTQGAGEITAGILSGSIAGDAFLTESNFINTLSNFSVATGSTLDLTDADALTLSGADTASYATLNAPTLDFEGNFTAADLLALNTDGVTQGAGSIAAGTLTSLGSIGGSVFLTRANAISVVSNVSVGSGDTLDLTDAGLLTLAGTVLAPYLTLHAGGLDFTGSINATLLDLASSAAVTQASGIIQADTLDTAGNIAGDLSLLDKNLFGTLGAIGASGNIAIGNDQVLDIAGLLSTSGTITLENTAGIDEIAGGTMAAGVLNSGGTGIGGSVSLTNSNAITDLAGFSLTPGFTLDLVNGQALTISGPVTADYATISAASLDLAGNLTSANILALASTGDIRQTAGSITAGTLISGGAEIGGDVVLTSATNMIGELGGFTLAGGKTLDLTDSGTLDIAGPVIADDATISAGSLDLTGDVTSTDTLALGSTSGITQTGGAITAGRLVSAGPIGGDVALTSALNAITDLGDFTVASPYRLDLTDGTALTLAGAIAAATGTFSATSIAIPGSLNITDVLALLSPGGVAETGTIAAGTLTSLDETDGNVFLTASNSIATLAGFSVGAGTFDLADTGLLTVAGPLNGTFVTLASGTIAIPGSITATGLALASTGSIYEDGGAIFTTSLISGGSIGGGVTLLGANDIGTLGNFTLGGDFALSNTSALVIAGLLTTPTGDVTLEDATAGIAALGGSIAAATLDTGGTTLGGDLRLTGGNTIAALGNITLATGHTLDLADAGLLNIAGTVTAPFDTLSVGSLSIAGGLDGTLLVLASKGTISESTGTIAVQTISGAGTIGGDVSLTEQNYFNTLSNFTMAQGASLDVNDIEALTLAGTILAPDASFTAPALIFDGLIDDGQLLVLSGASMTTEGPQGGIIAGTLISGGTIGNVFLTGDQNTIGTVGNFAVGALDTFALTDTGTLVLAGSIFAPYATFSAGSIEIPGFLTDPDILALLSPGGVAETGTIAAGTLTSLDETDGNVFLTASNSIATLAGFSVGAGTFDLADTGLLTVAGPVNGAFVTLASGTIAIPGSITATGLALASTGSIYEDGGAIFTTSLTSGGSIGGGVTLLGANDIGTLGNFTLGGDFALSNTSALVIAGLLTTPTGDVTLEDATAGIAALGGSIAAATLDTGGTTLGGDLRLTGGNTIAALGNITLATGHTLDLADAGLLNIAGTVTAPFDTLSAGSLAIAGGLDGTLLALAAQGTVAESTGTIAVATLASLDTIGGDVWLTSSFNTITELAGFTLAPGATLDLDDTGTLDIAGPVVADYASFSAGSLNFTGLVDSQDTLALASATGITQTGGTITAGNLVSDGTIGGNVALTGANSITNLGDFTVAAGHTLALTDAGALTLAGAIAAPSATFSAQNIAIPGSLLDTVVLALLSPGGVTETGSITAGTLTSLTDADGNVVMTGANSIATLGGFTVSQGSTLDLGDTGLLTVAGPVDGSFITLASGTIAIPGDITASDLVLAAAGSIYEDGGAIFATSLTSGGTVGQGVTLLGGNDIGTLGNFALDGNFALSNTGTLIIAGLLATPTGDVTLEDAGAHDIAEIGGSILAATLDTGGTTLGGNLLLDGNNTLAALGAITLAAGQTFNLFDASSLSVAGTVTAPYATLSASAFGIVGGIDGTLLALFTPGSITEAGALSAIDEQTLTGIGTIGGSAFLTGDNAINTISNVTLAAGMTLDVNDTIGLTLAGGIFAPTALLTAPSETFDGLITDTLLVLGGASLVTESAAGGIGAATLASDGTLGNVSLTSGLNSIASIGGFAVGGGDIFALQDNGPLSLAGPISGGVIDLTDDGALSVNGKVTGVSLMSLISTGLLTDAGLISAPVVTLSGAGISITGAGTIDANTSLALEATGDVLESGGTIDAAILSSGGTTIGGNALLLDGSNTISTLANIALTGNFALDNTGTLNIAGALTTPGTVTLEDSSNVFETTGFIDAASLNSGTGLIAGSASFTNAGNTIGALGNLTVGSTLVLDDTGLLTIAGTVAAPDATYTAGTIAIDGALTGTQLAFLNDGFVTEATGGTIAVATLTSGGGSDGTIVLLQRNTIGTLGAFAATGNFALFDQTALAIDGLVTTPGSITLEGSSGISEIAGGLLDAAALNAGGTTIGGDVVLTNANSIATIGQFAAADIRFQDARSYAIDGLVGTPGSLVLGGDGFAETGGGVIDAGILASSGQIAGSGTLNGANKIGTLGNFSATGDLLLSDGKALDLDGLVHLGGTLGLLDTGAISQTGGGVTVAALTSDAGIIGGNVVLDGANSIATLGSFETDGGLALNDLTGLNIAAPVYVKGELALQARGDVIQTGGSLTAGTLDTGAGSISGALLLDNPSNLIGTLGNLTAIGGLSLDDAHVLTLAGNLDVGTSTAVLSIGDGFGIWQASGSVTAGTLDIPYAAEVLMNDENSIAVLGNVSIAQQIEIRGVDDVAGPLEAIDAYLLAGAGRNISITGPINVSGDLEILSGEGITLDGVDTAGRLFEADAAGAFTQTGGMISSSTVDINAQDFEQTGGTIAGAGINLTAPIFAQSAGTIDAGNLSIDGDDRVLLAGFVSVANLLSVFSFGTISDQAGLLTAADAALRGQTILLDGNNVAGTLTASAGLIDQGSGVISAGAVSLNGSGIALSGGSLGVSGLLAFNDTSYINQTGGAVTAGTFALESGGVFTQTGGVLNAGSLNLFAQGITQGSAGVIDAGVASLYAGFGIQLAGTDSFTGGLRVTSQNFYQIGQTISAGYANISASNAMDLSGLVSVAGALDLSAGTFDQAEGEIEAEAIAIDAAGELTLNGNILDRTALKASAGGDIQQTTGFVTAPAATLTAGNNIILNGGDNFAGDLDLVAGGDILHNAGDNLVAAGTLTGSGDQLALFDAPTDFGTIGSFVLQDSTFSLDNLGPLTIIGPLVANAVSITAPGQITLDGTPDGGLFIAEPNGGKLSQTPQPGDSVITVTQAPGAGNPLILQTGIFYVDAGGAAADFPLFSNQPANLFFVATPQGDIQFAPSPPQSNGLVAPSITGLFDLGATGSASGNVDLLSLIILSGVATNLTGELDGLSGQAAAGKGTVDPFPKPPFQFNACPIGSVNCIIIPIETLPTNNPLQNFDIDQRKKRKLDKNVALPGVATRDF